MTPHHDELLGRYLDETLPPQDFPELQTLLREHSEARARLRLLATVSEGLQEQNQSYAAPRAIAQSRQRAYLPWALAATAAFVAILGWIRPMIMKTPAEAPASEFVALLVDEAEASFAKGLGPEDVRFHAGRFELESGAVHLRFSNGADIVMQAPAAFVIDDAFHLRLETGGFRAIVPPSAQGFTVATPGIDYEDLGTEFGVTVDPNTGRSELHVFDGQVDAKVPGSGELLSSVLDGESVQFIRGELLPAKAPSPDQFITPDSIGFLRWQMRQELPSHDPDLIGYFPFVPQADGEVLKNVSTHSIIADGQIQGARWVTGRWPGKKALLFDRDDDFVELEIPGEFRELTFAAWVKIDRFDFSHIAILNSNGWREGDLHWQLNRSGTAWLAGYQPAGVIEGPRLVAPGGQWVHLAATISLDQLESRVYLNGMPAGARKVSPETILQPGFCRIGNWLWDDDWPYVPDRAFRGRIDELTIWKRALTGEEIQKSVTEGKPAALWSFRPE